MSQLWAPAPRAAPAPLLLHILTDSASHRFRKLTVQGEFPGCPPTTRNFRGCWSCRVTLLPHFSNNTSSEDEDSMSEILGIHRWAIQSQSTPDRHHTFRPRDG